MTETGKRLCLLCEKYKSISNWSRHKKKCEQKFKKSRGIVWNYGLRKCPKGSEKRLLQE